MQILVVSQARYGIKEVISEVLPRLKQRGLRATYLTIPTNSEVKSIEKKVILSEQLLQSLENSMFYVIYGVLYFWARAYVLLSSLADDYDMIWFHNPRLLYLYPRQANQTHLITYHNHMLYRKASRHSGFRWLYYYLFGKFEKLGVRKFCDAHYTVVSKDCKKELISAGVNPSSVTYIGNGVDTDRFDADRSECANPSDPDRKVFLSLGRLAPQKRPHLLIKTLDKVSNETSYDITAYVAGGGECREKVEKYVEENSIKDIHILGYVEEDVKMNLYESADYFILSSAYEGEPLVLYEALASGLPCIVSDIDKLKFVEKNGCGTLVNFSDIKTAVDAITEFIDTNDRQQQENARQYAKCHLSWNHKVTQYYALIENIL